MLLAQLQPPSIFTNLLPGGLQGLAGLLWLAVLGVGALVVLFLLWRLLFAGKKRSKAPTVKAQEKLGDYPPLKANSGDRRLLIEGIPVRMRLLIVAPAGTAADIDEDELDKMLERVLPGLGEIYKQDKPRVKVWPTQISNEGFAHTFHSAAVIPEAEGELSPWACVAGRAKLGKTQLMIGMALQGMKPNTIGRRTIEAHEWGSILRVRVRSEA